MNRLLAAFARPAVAFGLAAALAVLGLVLMLLGWPEQSRLQKMLLQLSGLGLSLAVGAIVMWFVSSRGLWQQGRFRYVGYAMLSLLGLGVLVYLVAVITDRGSLTPLGQFFIWLGFGVAAVYLMIKGVDRATATTERSRLIQMLEGEDDPDAEDAGGRLLP